MPSHDAFFASRCGKLFVVLCKTACARAHCAADWFSLGKMARARARARARACALALAQYATCDDFRAAMAKIDAMMARQARARAHTHTHTHTHSLTMLSFSRAHARHTSGGGHSSRGRRRRRGARGARRVGAWAWRGRLRPPRLPPVHIYARPPLPRAQPAGASGEGARRAAGTRTRELCSDFAG